MKLLYQSTLVQALNEEIERIQEQKSTAIEFGNYGKAAELNGKEKGLQKAKRMIFSGDFNMNNKGA